MGTCFTVFSEESPGKTFLDGQSSRKTNNKQDLFKATTNLFGNDNLSFQREPTGPVFASAKKGTNVKTQELLGSNPISHQIKQGNNFQTKGSRSNVLNAVHGSSGMSSSLFSGHDNSELKTGNEKNKRGEFHFTQAKEQATKQVKKATAGVQWVHGKGTPLTL